MMLDERWMIVNVSMLEIYISIPGNMSGSINRNSFSIMILSHHQFWVIQTDTIKTKFWIFDIFLYICFFSFYYHHLSQYISIRLVKKNSKNLTKIEKK